MVRHIERDYAKAIRQAGVVEEVVVLAAVGAGCMEAEKWNSRAGLLDENAMGQAAVFNREVTPGDWFVCRHVQLG
jgi:hypothetical protein